MNETSERPARLTKANSSTNVRGLLQGDSQQCNHYIDGEQSFNAELDRFTRGFADQDRRERQKERQRKLQSIDNHRRQLVEKEQQKNQLEDRNAMKYFERIDQSQKLHEIRLKKTAHTNSLPFNPINHQYDHTPSGEQLKRNDSEHRLKQLVRAHNLITRGTSGYNVINGRADSLVEGLVPTDLKSTFVNKLNDHYERYRLKASSQTDVFP